jgi:hypothetical protein
VQVPRVPNGAWGVFVRAQGWLGSTARIFENLRSDFLSKWLGFSQKIIRIFSQKRSDFQNLLLYKGDLLLRVCIPLMFLSCKK